jgi:hypothetical protein
LHPIGDGVSLKEEQSLHCREAYQAVQPSVPWNSAFVNHLIKKIKESDGAVVLPAEVKRKYGATPRISG